MSCITSPFEEGGQEELYLIGWGSWRVLLLYSRREQALTICQKWYQDYLKSGYLI